MSSTEERTNPAAELGIQAGMTVQEFGYDDDTDETLRDAVQTLTGTDLVDDAYDDVADAVIIWHRDEDGDLDDALAKGTKMLDGASAIVLLTPKSGSEQHVELSEIKDAAARAGLQQVESVDASTQWNCVRLTSSTR
ncbi:DUF3052 family protein [Streptomyces sp. NPDC102473]|uniref:DUF3052 family protein n=1 Tax=Streptomyces sp. NPDC102473 TaxID=3366180 RepID=UPI0037FB80E0